MRIVFKLEQDDLLEAQRQHAGLRIRAMQACGILLIIAGIVALASNPKQYAAYAAILLGPFFIFQHRIAVRQSFKQDTRLQQRFEAKISDGGIELSNPTGSSKYPWNAFNRFVESKNLFLVYQAAQVFNVFPKRAFTAEEQQALRALLSERVRSASVTRSRISPQIWILGAVVLVAAILLLMVIIRNVR